MNREIDDICNCGRIVCDFCSQEIQDDISSRDIKIKELEKNFQDLEIRYEKQQKSLTDSLKYLNQYKMLIEGKTVHKGVKLPIINQLIEELTNG